MISESHFPADVRIRQEALKLVEYGHSILVIALKDEIEPWYETRQGVEIYRIPKIEFFRRGKQGKTKGMNSFKKLKDKKIGICVTGCMDIDSVGKTLEILERFCNNRMKVIGNVCATKNETEPHVNELKELGKKLAG